MNFTPFPKMARLNRKVIITEKIDGTNASIFIYDPAENTNAEEGFTSARDADGKVWNIKAGSRTRWITPTDDNFGFAAWVWDNADDLVKLGPGHHFGEWWGQGIQRNYGLDERRFSLFNTSRWCDPEERRFSLFNTSRWCDPEERPDCCNVVPLIRIAPSLNSSDLHHALGALRSRGSFAAPQFMNPEGIVVYHTAGNVSFKVTLKNDDKPKGA